MTCIWNIKIPSTLWYMTFTNTMAITGSLLLLIITKTYTRDNNPVDLRCLQKVVFLAVPPFISYVLLMVTLHYICAQYDAK